MTPRSDNQGTVTEVVAKRLITESTQEIGLSVPGIPARPKEVSSDVVTGIISAMGFPRRVRK